MAVLVAGLALLPALLVRPAPAQARFAVFPSVLDVRRPPGGVSVGTFNVRLSGERGQRFRVDIQDAVQQPDGSFAFRKPTGSRFSASTWVSVSPGTFRGSPNRVQPIEYRVRVPRTAEPGDHVTSLTVKRLPRRGPGTATVQAVSVRLTVRVAGRIREDVDVGSLGVPTMAGGGPVTVSVTAHNTGNVRLDFEGRNKGSVRVLGGSTEKASLSFRGVLFPDQIRSFRLAWQDPPLLGKFRAQAKVDTREGPATRSREFWVVPWRQAAALILVALAIVILAAGRGRRRRARDRRL